MRKVIGGLDLGYRILDQLRKVVSLFLRDHSGKVLNLGCAFAHEDNQRYFGNAAHPGVAEELGVECQQTDRLISKAGSCVIVLGWKDEGKVFLRAVVTNDLTAKVHAGKLIQAMAKQVGGSGGGRPDLAEAGGKDTAGLKTALLSVPSMVEALL